MTTEIVQDHDNSDSIHFGSQSPITCFTEDESMTRDVVRSWANTELKPLVRQMDDDECIDSEILQQLFDNGFMAMVSFVAIQYLDCLYTLVTHVPWVTCWYLNDRKFPRNMEDQL